MGDRRPTPPEPAGAGADRGGDAVGEWTDPTLIDRRDRLMRDPPGIRPGGRGVFRRASIARSSPRPRTSALGDSAVAVTAVSESLASGELEEAEGAGRADRDPPPGHPDRGVRRPELPPQQPRPLLLLQERALRPALGHARRAGGRRDRLGGESRRRGRPPPRHEGCGRERRAPPAPGVRPGQGRRPGPGQGLGPPHLGQARHPLPVEPDRLRRGRHPRAGPDGRPGRAVAPRQAGSGCSASATTRATSPGSRSPSRSCPGSPSAEVRDELVRAFQALGFKYVTLDLEGFRSGSLNARDPAGQPADAGGDGPGLSRVPVASTLSLLLPRTTTDRPMPRATCRCGEPLNIPDDGTERIVCPKCSAKVRVRPKAVGPDKVLADGFIRFSCPCGRRLKVKADADAGPTRQVPRLRAGRPRPLATPPGEARGLRGDTQELSRGGPGVLDEWSQRPARTRPPPARRATGPHLARRRPRPLPPPRSRSRPASASAPVREARPPRRRRSAASVGCRVPKR